MANYDPTVIQEFAKRLYDRADSVVRGWMLMGGLLGLFFGAFLIAILHSFGPLLGMAIGAYIGYGIGKEKAFMIRLQAQTALCQAKIEENTRKA